MVEDDISKVIYTQVGKVALEKHFWPLTILWGEVFVHSNFNDLFP